MSNVVKKVDICMNKVPSRSLEKRKSWQERGREIERERGRERDKESRDIQWKWSGRFHWDLLPTTRKSRHKNQPDRRQTCKQSSGFHTKTLKSSYEYNFKLLNCFIVVDTAQEK